ncbi:hypothetical protein HDV05_000189 [Chytridiales sp. JEL 0842]|nr:hypothetical protein HDV05_000189 [Chytridiales sp. JEL 0842]
MSSTVYLETLPSLPSDGDPTHTPPLSDPAWFPSSPNIIDKYITALSAFTLQLIQAHPSLKLALLGNQNVDFRSTAKLKALPEGYRLFQKLRSVGKKHSDVYMFGHPRGNKFRSPNEFQPHLKWMLMYVIGERSNCECIYCGGLPAVKIPILPTRSNPSTTQKDPSAQPSTQQPARKVPRESASRRSQPTRERNLSTPSVPPTKSDATNNTSTKACTQQPAPKPSSVPSSHRTSPRFSPDLVRSSSITNTSSPLGSTTLPISYRKSSRLSPTLPGKSNKKSSEDDLNVERLNSTLSRKSPRLKPSSLPSSKLSKSAEQSHTPSQQRTTIIDSGKGKAAATARKSSPLSDNLPRKKRTVVEVTERKSVNSSPSTDQQSEIAQKEAQVELLDSAPQFRKFKKLSANEKQQWRDRFRDFPAVFWEAFGNCRYLAPDKIRALGLKERNSKSASKLKETDKWNEALVAYAPDLDAYSALRPHRKDQWLRRFEKYNNLKSWESHTHLLHLAASDVQLAILDSFGPSLTEYQNLTRGEQRVWRYVANQHKDARDFWENHNELKHLILPKSEVNSEKMRPSQKQTANEEVPSPPTSTPPRSPQSPPTDIAPPPAPDYPKTVLDAPVYEIFKTLTKEEQMFWKSLAKAAADFDFKFWDERKSSIGYLAPREVKVKWKELSQKKEAKKRKERDGELLEPALKRQNTQSTFPAQLFPTTSEPYSPSSCLTFEKAVTERENTEPPPMQPLLEISLVENVPEVLREDSYVDRILEEFAGKWTRKGANDSDESGTEQYNHDRADMKCEKEAASADVSIETNVDKPSDNNLSFLMGMTETSVAPSSAQQQETLEHIPTPSISTLLDQVSTLNQVSQTNTSPTLSPAPQSTKLLSLPPSRVFPHIHRVNDVVCIQAVLKPLELIETNMKVTTKSKEFDFSRLSTDFVYWPCIIQSVHFTPAEQVWVTPMIVDSTLEAKLSLYPVETMDDDGRTAVWYSVSLCGLPSSFQFHVSEGALTPISYVRFLSSGLESLKCLGQGEGFEVGDLGLRCLLNAWVEVQRGVTLSYSSDLKINPPIKPHRSSQSMFSAPFERKPDAQTSAKRTVQSGAWHNISGSFAFNERRHLNETSSFRKSSRFMSPPPSRRSPTWKLSKEGLHVETLPLTSSRQSPSLKPSSSLSSVTETKFESPTSPPDQPIDPITAQKQAEVELLDSAPRFKTFKALSAKEQLKWREKFKDLDDEFWQAFSNCRYLSPDKSIRNAGIKERNDTWIAESKTRESHRKPALWNFALASYAPDVNSFTTLSSHRKKGWNLRFEKYDDLKFWEANKRLLHLAPPSIQRKVLELSAPTFKEFQYLSREEQKVWRYLGSRRRIDSGFWEEHPDLKYLITRKVENAAEELTPRRRKRSLEEEAHTVSPESAKQSLASATKSSSNSQHTSRKALRKREETKKERNKRELCESEFAEHWLKLQTSQSKSVMPASAFQQSSAAPCSPSLPHTSLEENVSTQTILAEFVNVEPPLPLIAPPMHDGVRTQHAAEKSYVDRVLAEFSGCWKRKGAGDGENATGMEERVGLERLNSLNNGEVSPERNRCAIHNRANISLLMGTNEQPEHVSPYFAHKQEQNIQLPTSSVPTLFHQLSMATNVSQMQQGSATFPLSAPLQRSHPSANYPSFYPSPAFRHVHRVKDVVCIQAILNPHKTLDMKLTTTSEETLDFSNLTKEIIYWPCVIQEIHALPEKTLDVWMTPITVDSTSGSSLLIHPLETLKESASGSCCTLSFFGFPSSFRVRVLERDLTPVCYVKVLCEGLKGLGYGLEGVEVGDLGLGRFLRAWTEVHTR